MNKDSKRVGKFKQKRIHEMNINNGQYIVIWIRVTEVNFFTYYFCCFIYIFDIFWNNNSSEFYWAYLCSSWLLKQITKSEDLGHYLYTSIKIS